MNLTVRYYASIREAVGCSSEALDTQAACWLSCVPN